ncbi:MAG TPA: hypothetical protein VFZ55_06280 [Nitrososphaera sp.]
MVVITLSKLIDEKILLLQELMNANNKPQVHSTYQIQIDTIRSIDDYDLQKLESSILQKKELLIISKDTQETEKLLAEIDALEWLQAQIVVLSLGIGSRNNNNDSKAALGI